LFKLTGVYPWYFVLPSAIILAGLVWHKYRREVEHLPPLIYHSLPTLRALAIFLICMMFLQPVLTSVISKEVGQRKILLVLDNSESMGQKDHQMKPFRKVQLLSFYGLVPDEIVNLNYVKSANLLSQAANIWQFKIKPIVDNIDIYSEEDMGAELGAEFKKAVHLSKESLNTIYRRKLWGKVAEDGKDSEKIRKQTAKLESRLKTLEKEWPGFSFQDKKEAERISWRIKKFYEEIAMLREALLESQDSLSRTFLELEEETIKEAQTKLAQMNRWERLRKITLESENSLLEQIQLDYPLTCYTLTGENQDLPLFKTSPGTTLDKAAFEFPTIPTGFSTDLLGVILKKAKKDSDIPVGTVVLFSDGEHNSEVRLEYALRQLSEFRIPVCCIGMGAEVPPRDVSIVKVKSHYPRIKYGETLTGEITLKANLEKGEKIPLRIESQNRVVWKETVTHDEKSSKRTVPFRINTQNKLREEASYTFKVFAERKKGEEVLENNQAQFKVKTTPTSPKVLLVDSRPRWEVRYLKTMFERNPEYDLIAKITKEIVTAEFPVFKEELLSYKLIIFGDIPPDWLGREQKQWIAEFARKGGGIIFIDSKNRNIGKYRQGPLKDLLPIEGYSSESRATEFSLKLSRKASGMEMFNLPGSRTGDEKFWSEFLPKFYSVIKVRQAPGVEILAETNPGGHPVFLTKKYEAGRVFYSAVDEIWRWRFKGDEYTNKFWETLATWVIERPYMASDKYVSLDLDKITFALKEEISVRAQVKDIEGNPLSGATVEAVITSLTRDKKELVVPLQEKEKGSGKYAGTSEPLEVGEYKIKVRVPTLPVEEMKAEAEITVGISRLAQRNLELSELTWNEGNLKKITSATGGKYFREEDSDKLMDFLHGLPKVIEERQNLFIWQSGWLFGFVVTILTAEWMIRKRYRLL